MASEDGNNIAPYEWNDLRTDGVEGMIINYNGRLTYNYIYHILLRKQFTGNVFVHKVDQSSINRRVLH
jgi:hypothetical protein